MANIFASFCINDGHPYADEIHLACERGVIRRWVERTGKSDMSRSIASSLPATV